MQRIYTMTGTTRQNVQQRYKRMLELQEEQRYLEGLMYQIRDDHPGLGALKMYSLLRPGRMGRDRFVAFYRESGFCLRQRPNFRRTTDSSGVIRFPNLVEGKKLTTVNQVWVSDITYYEMVGRFYYLTFIVDLFSRKIVGYSLGKRLLTRDTTIPALEMALKGRVIAHKIIFHSDGGGQYYSKEFLERTAGLFIGSMGHSVYENAYAERVNGIIKNEYIRHWQPKSFPKLAKCVEMAVKNYNNKRPHRSLGNRTPHQVYQTYQQRQELSKKQLTRKNENIFLST